MARYSDKLTFNTLHIMQETLLSLSLCNMFALLESLDFVSLFRNVFDMNTFILIFRNWNLSQPMINTK